MNKDTFIEQLESPVEHRLIPLTQNRFVMVDAEDYEKLAEHKWCLGGRNAGYAHRSVNGGMVKMHREILDVPVGLVVAGSDMLRRPSDTHRLF